MKVGSNQGYAGREFLTQSVALEKYGVSVVGGRVPGVGVSGLLLGGGFSWFSNQRGLAMDNVVSYEVVLPSGKVVTASENSEKDLFWGLKVDCLKIL
jgi:FAD/FMN-containing dehydrogenase